MVLCQFKELEMNAKERKRLKELAIQLRTILYEIDAMAEEVERHVMKKTTRRLPR